MHTISNFLLINLFVAGILVSLFCVLPTMIRLLINHYWSIGIVRVNLELKISYFEIKKFFSKGIMQAVKLYTIS